MPTRKRRVGFIPRSEVLELINKLSYESNLSYSKIINILVEEALHNRGMLNIKTDSDDNFTKIKDVNVNQDNKENVNKEFNYNFKKNLLKDKDLYIKDVKEESLDREIYAKFLIFLQFQERMKKRMS